MVLRQHEDTHQASLTSTAARGALMLRTAQGVDRLMLRGIPFRDALHELKREYGAAAGEIIAALEDYKPALSVVERKRARVFELQSSMIVEDDVMTRDGIMILGRETALNPMLIERVRNFAKTRGVCEPIRVRIPRTDPAPVDPESLAPGSLAPDSITIGVPQ
jgi:hypothetical protein